LIIESLSAVLIASQHVFLEERFRDLSPICIEKKVLENENAWLDSHQ